MLESPLPRWVKDQLEEMIEAYQTLIPLLLNQCEGVAAGGLRNADGELWDRVGTLDEYRLDAKYAAGQVSRLSLMMQDRIKPGEWQDSPYAEMAKNPVSLASWAWSNPWKHQRLRFIPTAMDQAPLEWRDFYLLYPERERRALVYTMGCGMTIKETADTMGITAGAVKAILARARARGRNARDTRAGIKMV